MALDPLAHSAARDAPAAGQTWLDDGRLDDEWRWPRPQMSLSRRLTIGIPVAVIALIIVLVAVFGGFGARADRIERVPLGTEMTSGALVFTFSQAVVTAPGKYDSDKVWTVSVYGTVRTTSTDTETPRLMSSASLLLTAPGIDDLLALDRYTIGTRLGYSYHSAVVTPGLPAVPVRLQFKVPLTWHPTGIVQVLVQQQVYTDITFLKTGEQGWRRIPAATETLVPAVVA